MPPDDDSMHRIIRISTVGLLAAALAAPLFAQATPGPPDWADGGASVYLGMKHKTPPRAELADASTSNSAATSTVASASAATPPLVDHSAALAAHHSPPSLAVDNDNRRLAPRTGSHTFGLSAAKPADSNNRVPGSVRNFADFGLPLESIYTVLSALAVVVGAFFVFVWLLRRGGRKTGNVLPADVVSVVGRVPLAGRQIAELLRVGNKLVLVSLTPTSAETITEVTDPVEVDRLVGICQQHNPHSTTQAFEQVFRRLSRESAPPGFLGQNALPTTHSSAAANWAQRGENARD